VINLMRADTGQRAAERGIFVFGIQRFGGGCDKAPHHVAIQLSKGKNVAVCQLSPGEWKSGGIRPEPLSSARAFERAPAVKAKHYDSREILSAVPGSIG
jgi:hypothetical protein